MHEDNKGHGHEVTVIVNGREVVVKKEDVTFDEIVNLAIGLPTGPDVLYTVTYRKANGKKEEGILVEGESVKVKNGTIFNVTATNKS